MTDKARRLDNLFFPNALPDRQGKAPPNANRSGTSGLQKPFSTIPITPSKPCTHSKMTISRSRRKSQPIPDFATTRNIIEYRRQLLKLIRLMGLSDYFLQQLPWTEKAKQPFGTLPKKLWAIYEKERFFEQDLALQHVKTTGSPVFMSAIEDFIFETRVKTCTIRRYRDLIAIGRCFGYHDFYYMPLNTQDGRCNVLLAVTAKDMNSTDLKQLIQDHKAELQSLAQAFYLIGIMKLPAFFPGTQSLRTRVIHPRPLELLNLMAKEDLALKQVADRLCIKEGTVHKHMASAKRALGVRTPAAAVYRAIKEGLILADR